MPLFGCFSMRAYIHSNDIHATPCLHDPRAKLPATIAAKEMSPAGGSCTQTCPTCKADGKRREAPRRTEGEAQQQESSRKSNLSLPQINHVESIAFSVVAQAADGQVVHEHARDMERFLEIHAVQKCPSSLKKGHRSRRDRLPRVLGEAIG